MGGIGRIAVGLHPRIKDGDQRTTLAEARRLGHASGWWMANSTLPLHRLAPAGTGAERFAADGRDPWALQARLPGAQQAMREGVVGETHRRVVGPTQL